MGLTCCGCSQGLGQEGVGLARRGELSMQAVVCERHPPGLRLKLHVLQRSTACSAHLSQRQPQPPCTSL